MPEIARSVALVTGASSGIGKAFARALADRGHDVVLVARDVARLEELAEEVRVAYGKEAEVLAADLTDTAQLGAVEARLADTLRPVDLLVNNAGFGTIGAFAEADVEAEDREIRLNVLALVRLTHAVLPGLVARGGGGVINVSSVGGYQPTPGNATYGGTKAFVTSFTHAVHEELRGTGVRMMVLCPGFTRTEFQQRAGISSSDVPGFLWQSAEEVVQQALRAYERGRAAYVTGSLNQVAAAFSSALPGGVTRRLAGAILKRSD